MPTLLSKFRGCLLGLAVGDGLGAFFEGQSPSWIGMRYAAPLDVIQRPPRDELYYTDDTQMAIGVAEALIESGGIEETVLCRKFALNYEPTRGYGRGARMVLQAIQQGDDYQRIAATSFPGGSFGNGAAMRVAPVGLFFHENHDQLWRAAKAQSLPTHTHALGYEGAQLLALAAALCVKMETFDHNAFFAPLLAAPISTELKQRLRQASQAITQDLPTLGNGIAALDSVPTAIAVFATSPHNYAQAIGQAILLGGDTDTIAAMAGALCGAFLGSDAIPKHLLEGLEDGQKGRRYIEELATKLHAKLEPPV